VRPRLHRRRSVRHPAAGRPDAVRDALHGQLAEAYQETGGNVVAVVEVPREHTNRYGILKVGRDDGRLVEVTGLVEKPEPEAAPSNLSIIGRYVLMPEVIEHLARMDRGAGGEVQLTDAMARLIGTQPFHGCATRDAASTAATRRASWRRRSLSR
jgi:UTP-glucose-1-phosphate uridylyltransferase